jgi:hypothetical protein
MHILHADGLKTSVNFSEGLMRCARRSLYVLHRQGSARMNHLLIFLSADDLFSAGTCDSDSEFISFK